MGRSGSGVEVRDRSIRLSFTLDGKVRKETIRTDGTPMAPTPANVKYAHRLAAEIKDKIRHGTFVYADYFPASQHATTGHGTTVADQLDLWLGLQVDKESSTLKGYRVGVEWWKRQLGTVQLRALRHSQILQAFATEPKWTGKTRNNKASILRQAIALALRDEIIPASPMEGLEAASHQARKPDPFSPEEVALILAGLAERYHPQVVNYFETKFFTGMRTSESLALRWESIDWRLNQAVVSEAIVLGELKGRTKTHSSRVVELNSRALAALRRQKEHTFLAGGLVFTDPKTGRQWADDWTPREMYWRPMLKRLGIRYRSPYETRHTYATMMLMQGVTPAYAARQLGHSVEMFLRTYAKWMDGGQNAVEMGKIEAYLSRILPRPAVDAG